MFKLIFGLAFVSMILGKEYPGFQSLGSNKYFISEEKLNYLQAFAKCKSMKGGFLATEITPEDTKILDKELEDAAVVGDDFWIGGYFYNSAHAFAKWVWLDAQAYAVDMEYQNWADKKPIGFENCLLKTQRSDFLGKWRAVYCREEHRFICQIGKDF